MLRTLLILVAGLFLLASCDDSSKQGLKINKNSKGLEKPQTVDPEIVVTEDPEGDRYTVGVPPFVGNDINDDDDVNFSFDPETGEMKISGHAVKDVKNFEIWTKRFASCIISTPDKETFVSELRKVSEGVFLVFKFNDHTVTCYYDSTQK